MKRMFLTLLTNLHTSIHVIVHPRTLAVASPWTCFYSLHCSQCPTSSLLTSVLVYTYLLMYFPSRRHSKYFPTCLPDHIRRTYPVIWKLLLTTPSWPHLLPENHRRLPQPLSSTLSLSSSASSPSKFSFSGNILTSLQLLICALKT